MKGSGHTTLKRRHLGIWNVIKLKMFEKQKMQEELLKAQEKLEQSTYTAKAGGGVVTAVVSGKHELVSIKIDPEAVDPDDVEMLEDLIVAAVNSANQMVDTASSETMSKISGGLGL